MGTREANLEASDRKGQPGALDSYTGQFATGTKARPPLSTEYQAFIDRPHTAATLVHYPDGTAEITGCHMGFSPNPRPKNPASEFEKRERAQRRARRRLKLLTRFNSCRYLWTLTVRGGLADYRAALICWEKFVRRVRKFYPSFGAVGVPERHRGGGVNDGTFHIHFAVNDFFDVNVLREVWYSVVGFTADGKPMGQVDVQAPPRGKFSPSHVANYLMKYISKEIDLGVTGKWEHYYWITKNFIPPNLNLNRNRHLKFGYRSLVEYRGKVKDREARLLGLLFFLTGKNVCVAWRSEDGRDFRLTTVDEVDYAETG